MILGQTRTTFDPPAPPHAKLPHTGFYSGNFSPFAQVMHRMHAFPSYRPPMVPGAGPQMLPPVPVAPAPGPAVAATQVPSSAPTPTPLPTAAGTNGFGGSGFGSTGGVRGHFHVDSYMVMRSGYIPGVSPSGSNIRAGINNAGARIQRSMPFQTAPLPPPPPPPAPVVVAPVPAATHGFGFGYAHHGGHAHHGGRRRGWFSRMISPETVAEVQSREVSNPSGCETYPPRADGIKVTVCNGRAVKYEDAQGNVTSPADYGAYPSGGGMAGAGFGFSWNPLHYTPAGMAYNAVTHHGGHPHHRRHRYHPYA